MKELPEILAHNSAHRVMGISVDPKQNRMFSIGNCGNLIVVDLNDITTLGGKFISSQKLSSNLKAMIHDHERNVLFIADQSGSVFVMNCLPD
jgi:hypothetical protein